VVVRLRGDSGRFRERGDEVLASYVDLSPGFDIFFLIFNERLGDMD
jgi:hypothetical protein